MKFRSVDCHRLPDADYRDPWKMKPGEFYWSETRYETQHGEEVWKELWIAMPYEAGERQHSTHCIRVYRKGDSPPQPPRPCWEWDGDEDKPTLSPSIACGDPKGSNWHGYLEAGRLEACE